MAELETHSPEAAYLTKDNILVQGSHPDETLRIKAIDGAAEIDGQLTNSVERPFVAGMSPQRANVTVTALALADETQNTWED